MIIGIPQSLYFYYYYPFWSAFFKTLGFEVLLSPPTNAEIMAKGLAVTPDEYCLPVKIHRGHLAYLEERSDLTFSPGFGRHGRRGHFCPKLTGLPDVVRSKSEKAVTFWHDLDEEDRMDLEVWQKTLLSVNSSLSNSEIASAWEKAWKEQNRFVNSWPDSGSPMESIHRLSDKPSQSRNFETARFRLAIIGHPYLVYDPWITRRLFETLQKNQVEIVFQETVPQDELIKRWNRQGKRVYWPIGQEILSAARYYAEEQRVDGIIQISSCLCGPDAIIGDLLAKYLRLNEEHPFPLLQLTLDEHSGWAGLQTRVEAFIDLLRWRNRHAQI